MGSRRGRFTVYNLSSTQNIDLSVRNSNRFFQIAKESEDSLQKAQQDREIPHVEPVTSIANNRLEVFQIDKLVNAEEPEKVEYSKSFNENSKQLDPDQVPMSVLTIFQNALSGKFSEMLGMHKELMVEFLKKDQSREEKVRGLIKEVAEITRQNTQLQIENQKLRELISCRFRE